MKTLLTLEELAKLLLSYLGSLYIGFEWWVFPALLLIPDIGMLGYFFGARTGSWTYNLFHHQGMAIITGLLGYWFSVPELQLAGLILFGHSALDRALGYGLKHRDSFQHTHLGWIGKVQAAGKSLKA